MLILTIRTDKPEAELGLFDNSQQIAYETWHAHRQLAETIHNKITALVVGQNKQLHDVRAIALYKGPGSFTGLRIGASVGNALADALEVPIVAETGDGWVSQAIARLQVGENDKVVLPMYGAAPHITAQKK